MNTAPLYLLLLAAACEVTSTQEASGHDDDTITARHNAPLAQLSLGFDRDIEDLQSVLGDAEAAEAAEAAPWEVSSDLQQLQEEYRANSTIELDVAEVKGKMRTLMEGEREMISTCVHGSSGRTCPMRGSIFVEGNMRDAVIHSLDQDFPGLRKVIERCNAPNPPPYCTAAPRTKAIMDAEKTLKKVLVGRLKACKVFTREYQTKGLHLLKVLEEQANMVQYGERRPKTVQTDVKQRQTRYMHLLQIFWAGKLVTGLSGLLVTGMEEVNESLTIGPLALFIPFSAYAASLFFATTTGDNKIGAQMQHFIFKTRRGIQEQLTHVHNLLDKQIMKLEQFNGDLTELIKTAINGHTQLTKWFGMSMGDRPCYQSAVDCDFQAKAHNKMAAASKIENPWSVIQRNWHGHATGHQGGDTHDFSYILDIITKSDEIITYLQKGNTHMLPRAVAQLANTWNGLTTAHSGEVGRRSIFQMLTNIRVDDLNRENMRITHMFQYKDLQAEQKVQHHIKIAFDELNSGPIPQQQPPQQAPAQQSPEAQQTPKDPFESGQ